MSAPLLTLERLQLSLAGRPILRGLDLAVDAGEILGLAGESGSGKSMTALAILGLAPPGAEISGAICLAGEDLTRATERRMQALRGAGVAVVFQEPLTALNPVMTIGDQVAEPLRQHLRLGRAKARARAAEALRRVGLPPEDAPLDRYPHELSGGQRQRVAIAMATVLKPKLIIADEPTTALDVTTQAQVIELLTALAREDGAGLILISHDLALLAGACDRIAILKDGELVEAGRTAELFRKLSHPYARRLAADAVLAPRAEPARPPGPPILEVRDLVRAYGRDGRRVVDGVSFSVAEGESVGVVGESGSGKSTLLRAVLALEPLQGGAVRLDGQPFALGKGDGPARRRAIQAVFQDPYGSLDPRWTAERVILEPLHLVRPPLDRAAARARAAAMLRRVGLPPDALDRYPHQFSGGERQRLAIARALVSEPRLLVLDEAVSALDVTVRAQILALLAELSRDLRLSLLFVTHDLGVVRAVTDRVLVIKHGRLVESGPTEQVFRAPRQAYTRELIAATPDLRRALELQTA